MINETIIKLREDNIVEIESVDTDGTKAIKTVTFKDLIVALSASVSSRDKVEISHATGVLPLNRSTDVYTIYTKIYEEGNKVIGLYQPAHRAKITYYDTAFDDVGVPGLIYAISYNAKQQVTKVRITAVADDFITDSTEIYEYPFSNVSGGSGGVCFGRNNIFDIKYNSEVDLHSIPSMFLSMPNNDDSYGKNNSGLSHRKLLENLVGKDFPKEFLQKHSFTNREKKLIDWLNM